MESELLFAARQRDRSSIFEVEGTRDTFWVVRFAGSEGLSEQFQFEVEVAARHVELGGLIGRYARLKFVQYVEPRTIHALILRAEYLGEIEPRGLYRLTLVPWTYRLSMRTNCRIFKPARLTDVLTKIFTESGVAKSWFRFDFDKSRAREYCVQYRENDLDFVLRLLEDAGIYYYYMHEEERHVLVLTDRRGGATPIAGSAHLSYLRDGRLAMKGEEVIRRFSFAHELRSGRASVRGFDLRSPESPVLAASRGAGAELYDYVGQLERAAQDSRLAEGRLEAETTGNRRGYGASDCPRLTPGYGFTMGAHPLDEYDGEYCVVRVHHRGSQEDTVDASAEQALVYSNDFVVMPQAETFRAPRVTPRPVVHGVQTATVIAPAGEAVHVDELGQVKVQFHWDRRDGFDEDSSCWVPVSQAWAGNGLGAVFLPRVGHEVIVEFVEGDPDRPIVTGRVYHELNRPPLKLPDHKSRSTIRSETLDGGGANELRFEDQPGGEQLYLHAQRDMDVCVRNDRRDSVRGEEHRTVRKDRREHVLQSAHLKVGGDDQAVVDGKLGRRAKELHATITGDAKVAAAGAVHLTIGGAQHVKIDGAQHVKTGANAIHEVGGTAYVKATTVVIEASAGITLKGAGGFVTIDAAGVAIQGTTILLNSGGAALAGPGAPMPPTAPTAMPATLPAPAEGDE